MQRRQLLNYFIGQNSVGDKYKINVAALWIEIAAGERAVQIQTDKGLAQDGLRLGKEAQQDGVYIGVGGKVRDNQPRTTSVAAAKSSSARPRCIASRKISRAAATSGMGTPNSSAARRA